MVAKGSAFATAVPSAVVTSTVWALDAPSSTRIRACPLGGVASESSMIASPSLANRPTPATVRALSPVTSTVVDSTGGVSAAAPAGRMLTVYSPGGTSW